MNALMKVSAGIALSAITTDGGTQARAGLNDDVVTEYADAIGAGANMPPIVVFHDGKKYWLADGFHRYFAHIKARATEIDADVRKGTRRDAILYSVSANKDHGLRRTNADKRCAVKTLLADKEWRAWSDREIAELCGVSHPFVAAIRNPQAAERQADNRDASATRGAKIVNPSVQVESDSTRTPKPLIEDKFPDWSEPAKSDTQRQKADPRDAEIERLNAELAETRDNARELAAMVEASDFAAQGDESAAKQIKRLLDEISVLKSQRDGYMTKCNELIKTVKHWKHKAGAK